METKFRPIPITILDFLGVLIPGFLWLVLIAKTYCLLRYPSVRLSGPMDAWSRISTLASSGGSWLGPLSIILGALVAGYGLKPLAMHSAGFLSRPFFLLRKDTRKVGWKRMVFPFNCFFGPRVYYPRIGAIISDVTGVPQVDQLPGTTPFAAAKRYLHATAPTLWEESERMEAEVRMAGSLFLAAIYSAVLHLVLWCFGYGGGGLWVALSFISALVLAVGFNTLRLREVGYTYLNLLLAEGIQKRSASHLSKTGEPEKDAE